MQINPSIQSARDAASAPTGNLEPVVLPIHYDQGIPHLTLIVHFHEDPTDPSSPVYAVLGIEHDLNHILYTFTTGWPTPSDSAESLLVRKEPEGVRFLTPLLHRTNHPTQFVLPWSEENLPAKHALEGYTGPMQGRDYRGIPVLAYTRPIPHTPWAMVAKIDRSEAMKTANRYALLMVLSMAGLYGSLIAGFTAVQQRQRRRETQRRNLRIQESHALIQSALNALSSEIVILDQNGIIIRANRSWQNFAKKSDVQPEQVSQGVDYLEVCRQSGKNDPDADAVYRGLLDVQKGVQDEFIFEYPCHSPTRQQWFVVRVTPMPNPNGTFLVVAHEDITERKLAVEALKEREAQYSSLLNNASVGIFQTLSSGKPVYVNPELARMLDATSPEEALSHYQDLKNTLYVDPDRRDAFLHELTQNGKVKDFEYQARSISGNIKTFSMDATIAERDSHDSFLITGFVKDHSELMASKAATAAARESIIRAIHEAPFPMMIHAEDGRVLALSRSWTDFSGYSLSEIPTLRDWTQRAYPDHADEVAEYIKNVYGYETRVSEGEYSIHCKDGSTRIWDFYSVGLGEVDNHRTALSMAADITEQKNLWEQLTQSQKMESVGRLAGGVAHDFNNMLQTILTYCDMALELEIKNMELDECLDEIKKAGHRSADLTRQLLAFARKQTIIPKVQNLNQSVEGMLKMLTRLIGENIVLEWEPGEEDLMVYMDPSQIDQILANLCVNARDAIVSTGTITISTEGITLNKAYCEDHSDFTPGRYVVLNVQDNGIGMDSETRKQIFEPFFTTKAPGRGTGLGLATVYGIVLQNKGNIMVDSTPGVGTRFSIFLPRHAKELFEEDEAKPEDLPGGTECILLAEDSPTILRLTARSLERLGYQVLTSPNGEEALKVAKQSDQTLHLLITDVIMPEMNGPELAKHMKTEHPDIKVLFISGYTQDIWQSQGFDMSDVHLLRKPFSQAELAGTIRELLDSDPEQE